MKRNIKVIGIIISLYGLFHLTGIGCPIRFLTGISCAGCGMTRAWISVFKLDFVNAFHYHPLFLLPPLWLMGCCLRNKMSAMTKNVLMGLTIAAFVVCYAFRMIYGDGDVVYFHPQEGIFSWIVTCRDWI